MDWNDPLIAPFWAASEREQLVTCCCKNCALDIWYPENQCSQCGGNTTWRELGKSARLLSWTTVRRQINGAFEVPYTPAIVVPDDAPTVQLVTQLFLSEGQTPYCDMPLELIFRTLKPLQGEPFIAPVYREYRT
ncbi:Zn-ribbon domain-containing OB-fold protein [Litorivivens sp.]|uniref:Zn-ribbon domain-containing OB-fold protein n=1 Tax=Litorivivens sp. TaxID=2020868 RepID=UPI00356B16B0